MYYKIIKSVEKNNCVIMLGELKEGTWSVFLPAGYYIAGGLQAVTVGSIF